MGEKQTCDIFTAPIFSPPNRIVFLDLTIDGCIRDLKIKQFQII